MKYIVLFLSAVFVSSVSQIMLKKSANKSYESKVKEYMNPWVITSYALFFGATLITVIAYKYIPLSLGPILESSGYFFVTILGMIFLKEKVGKKKAAGLFIILAGIVIFNKLMKRY